MSSTIWWIIFVIFIVIFVVALGHLIYNVLKNLCHKVALYNSQENFSKDTHMNGVQIVNGENVMAPNLRQAESTPLVNGDTVDKALLDNLQEKFSKDVNMNGVQIVNGKNKITQNLSQAESTPLVSGDSVDKAFFDKNLYRTKNVELNSLASSVEINGDTTDEEDEHAMLRGETSYQKQDVIFKRHKSQISKSVDDLEYCDPLGIDTLKQIEEIADEAKQLDKKIDTFVGKVYDLKYLELNQKFIICMINLSEIPCESEDLRRRKRDIYNYIESCKKKLLQKAEDPV